MSKMITIAAALLACLACNHSLTEPIGPSGLGTWVVTEGAGKLTADGLGWRLEPPRSPQTCNYVQAVYAGAPPRGAITATFELTGSPDASWYTPGDTAPARLTLMLESRSGERMWAGGNLEYGGYRPRLDSPGLVTVSAPLDWRAWTGVYGATAPSEQAFADFLAHIVRVGVTFGGSSFYGHGVGVSTGSASIRLVSLTVGT